MYEYVINVCTTEKINITKKALDLIVKKANGDMRKLLNIMQSLYMHNFINKDIDVIIKEDNVSSVLSCPTETNIENIIKYVQKKSLNDSYKYIYNIVNKSGISVQELIIYIYEYYNNLIINTEPKCISSDGTIEQYKNVINRLALLNENLTYCNNENIQLISLVSIFYM